jgi:uncharacterized protein (DUF1810 family)
VSANDPFNLQRFVDAQKEVYEVACDELRAGEKRSHWMWFVFPQLIGLGSSQMATAFGISSRTEAVAYLNHPILGVRLTECTRLVNALEQRSIGHVFGYPDNLKFRSSMTLFALVTSENSIFNEALWKYFGGVPDPRTVERLSMS